jgi:hypothetical protein
MTSKELPAGAGTTTLTGFVGQDWAIAGNAKALKKQRLAVAIVV